MRGEPRPVDRIAKLNRRRELYGLMSSYLHDLPVVDGLEEKEKVLESDRQSMLLYIRYQVDLIREGSNNWEEQLLRAPLGSFGDMYDHQAAIGSRVKKLQQETRLPTKRLRELCKGSEEIDQLSTLFETPFTLDHDDIDVLFKIGERPSEAGQYSRREQLYQGKVFLAFCGHLLESYGFDSSIREGLQRVMGEYETDYLPQIEAQQAGAHNEKKFVAAWREFLLSLPDEANRRAVAFVISVASEFAKTLMHQEFGGLQGDDWDQDNFASLGIHRRYVTASWRRGERARDALLHMMGSMNSSIQQALREVLGGNQF